MQGLADSVNIILCMACSVNIILYMADSVNIILCMVWLILWKLFCARDG